MLHIFLDNMILIIAIVFLINRFKRFLVKRTASNLKFIYFLPIMAGLLSILIMLEPFKYKDMIFDLRTIPIFVVSYTLGLEKGLLTAILPSLYRLYLGGDNFWQEIVLPLILPILIANVFYDSKRVGSLVIRVNIKEALTGYLLFSLIRLLGQFFTMDIPVLFWLELNLNVTFFSILSLIVILLIIKDSNHLILTNKKLEQKANYDAMTNLPNLDYFKTEVKKMMKDKKTVTIVMFDIDNFKNYNDTHGHPAGDRVLKSLAQILKNNVREEDLVARYGGEEFILAIPNTLKKEKIALIASRIRKKVEAYYFEGEETQPNGCLTVSIGISSLSTDKELDQLIEEADKALYNSKSDGRNCINFVRC